MGNTELQEIYLYNNHLTDEGMDIFGQMLANKSNLFALGMEYNQIGSEGAAYILNSIKKLKNFEKLYLN